MTDPGESSGTNAFAALELVVLVVVAFLGTSALAVDDGFIVTAQAGQLGHQSLDRGFRLTSMPWTPGPGAGAQAPPRQPASRQPL